MMKRYFKVLGLSLCIGLANTCVFAQEIQLVPTVAPVEKSEDLVSIHQINMDVAITRAEFIIAIINTTDTELTPIMDTHYAMPAMKKAEQLGLVDLKAYPIDTWSEIMPNEEKVEVLSKAMQNSHIDIGKVYTALSQILVEHVEVDGRLIDLKGLKISHNQGKVMLPIRAVAEAMGFKITWDADSYTCTLNNGSITSTVQVGFDSYHYSSVEAIGMSAPFSVGVAPRLIEGTLYVPVDYFSMFADSEVTNSTVSFTKK